MKQYASARQPEKFSYIRMNVRSFSFSTCPNANRLSTTRLTQWYITGFSVESFQGAMNRACGMT
ncbi:MAG: hypothetical protein NTV46_19270 [Verrucomicrobia bacterium]|nr:hypothetical protein [Verrucomicrobiota bacterium]